MIHLNPKNSKHSVGANPGFPFDSSYHLVNQTHRSALSFTLRDARGIIIAYNSR